MHDDLTAASELQHDPATVTHGVGRGILRRIASAHRAGDDHHLDSVLAGIPDRDLKAAAGACGWADLAPLRIIADERLARADSRDSEAIIKREQAAILAGIPDDPALRPAVSVASGIPDETITRCVEAFHAACRAMHTPGGDEADVDDEIREGIVAALAVHMGEHAHVLDETVTALRRVRQEAADAIDYADRTGLAS